MSTSDPEIVFIWERLNNLEKAARGILPGYVMPKPVHPSDADADGKIAELVDKARAAVASDVPATCLTDGSPVTPEHRDIRPDGMQNGYVVLCPEERARGFIRPVRRSYKHTKCGTVTTMGLALAETYARDPKFYSGTFCCGCRTHFPVAEFTWVPDDSVVGS